MKDILLTAALAIGLAISAVAQVGSPVFVTQTASGTTTAVTFFATSPTLQMRVVGAIVSSDLAGSMITFKSGTTPATISATNTAGATISVAATNGFNSNGFIIVETKGGVLTNAQIASFSGTTNIVLYNSVMATVPGDQIYTLGTATSLAVGATTNKNYQGEALFVGQRGRPAQVIVNGTSACSLDSITARYE
jgi:small nuclear ribonucleoprotein (snRNP)-like protein